MRMLLLCVLLVGCLPAPTAPARWKRGDIVCIALTGERAMVTSAPLWGGYSWGYRIRLGKEEKMDRLRFHEYELEACP